MEGVSSAMAGGGELGFHVWLSRARRWWTLGIKLSSVMPVDRLGVRTFLGSAMHARSSAMHMPQLPLNFAWKRGARPLIWQFGLGQEMEAQPSFMASSRSVSVLPLVR
ncbi:hypothetical protein Dimus_022608 [Dionaea muscipula]